MEVKDILGLLGLALVVGLLGTAIKNGTQTASVLNSAFSGFNSVLRTATQQS